MGGECSVIAVIENDNSRCGHDTIASNSLKPVASRTYHIALQFRRF